MDLYDVAVARKLSSGGGGGSSDFSTAEVTFINNTYDPVQVSIPFINGNYSYGQETDEGSFVSSGTSTKSVIVYKNGAVVGVFGKGLDVQVSGSATYEEPDIIITGDCTITIS